MNISNFISLVFKNKFLLIVFLLIPLVFTFFLEKFYKNFNENKNEFKYSIEIKLENNIDEYLRKYHIINTGHEAKDLDLVMYYKHIYAFVTNFISNNIILQDNKIKGLEKVEITNFKKIDFEVNPLGGLQTVIRIIIQSKNNSYDEIKSFFIFFEEKLQNESLLFMKEKQQLNVEVLEINKSINLSQYKDNYYNYLKDLNFMIEDIKSEKNIELIDYKNKLEEEKNQYDLELNKAKNIFEKQIKKSNNEIQIIEISLKYSDSFKGKFALSENYCSINRILFCSIAFPKNYNIDRLEFLLQKRNLIEKDYNKNKLSLINILEVSKNDYEKKKLIHIDALKKLEKASKFVQITKKNIEKLNIDSKFNANNFKTIKSNFYSLKKDLNNMSEFLDDFEIKFYSSADNQFLNTLSRLNNLPSLKVSKVKKQYRNNRNIITFTNLNEEVQIKQINIEFYLILSLFLSLSIYSLILIFRFKNSK